MTPPSLEAAREILADAAAKARASGDPFAEIAASAIDVVLAELDRRPVGDHGTVVRRQDSPRLPWWPDALKVGDSAHEIRPASVAEEPPSVEARVRATLACWSDEERSSAMVILSDTPDEDPAGSVAGALDAVGRLRVLAWDEAPTSDKSVMVSTAAVDPKPHGDVRPPAGTHEQECAIHIPGGECTCPAGWPSTSDEEKAANTAGIVPPAIESLSR